MKILFITLYLFLICGIAFSQTKNGVVAGVNYSIKSDTKDYSYASKVGFQLGYNWRIDTKTNWSFALSPMFVKTNMQTTFLLDGSYSDNYALGISIPLYLNYQLKDDIFFTGGYAFTYHLDSGALSVNEFDHALHAGIGYSFKFMDVNISYYSSINEDNSDVGYTGPAQNSYSNVSKQSFKTGSLRLSVVFPISGK